MRSIAFVTLWVFVFAMPWENAIVFPGVGTITRLLGFVTFGAGLLVTIVDGKLRRPGVFLVLTALFVLWGVTTAFWAEDPANVVRRSKTYAQLALMVWLLWELTPSENRHAGLLQAYVLGASLAAVATIRNYFSGANPIDARYTAAASNANELAMILALAIPMAWYLALTTRKWFWRWTNRLYVPLGMVGVLLTASRGGLITALVALTIVPWTMRTIGWRTRIAIGVLVVTGAFAASTVVPQSSWDRLSTTAVELQSGDIGSRGVIWKAGMKAFVRHQLVGVGAGGFRSAVEQELGRPFAAHNAFLAVMVEQGLIGITIFLALFAVAFRPRDRFATPEARFRLVLFATLVIGLMPLNWDYAKSMWFVLTMLAAQPLVHRAHSARRAPLPIAASHRQRAAPQPARLPVPSGRGVA